MVDSYFLFVGRSIEASTSRPLGGRRASVEGVKELHQRRSRGFESLPHLAALCPTRGRGPYSEGLR